MTPAPDSRNTDRPEQLWNVGDLAERTGVSARSLHYYEEIGLLVPSHRADSGQRLYTPRDVKRLQQLKSLQQLGFSLKEIRECFQQETLSAARVTQLHLARVREHIQLLQRLQSRLEFIDSQVNTDEDLPIERFLETVEVMSRSEKYLSSEQVADFQARMRSVEPEQAGRAELAWQELIPQVRAEMDKGTDPASPQVQQLARQWMGLVREKSGGDPGLERGMRTMLEQESTIQGQETGPLRELMNYITRALMAARPPA